MNFKHFKKIRSVKDPWLDLEIKGLDTYQSYLFNEICYKYRVSSITNIRNGNIKCDFIVGYENNIPVCIAPLVIDKKPEKVIRLLGHGTNVGYLDFIYNDPQYVPLMQEHICEIYGGGVWH